VLVRRMSPFAEIAALQRELSNLFDRIFGSENAVEGAFVPATDAYLQTATSWSAWILRGWIRRPWRSWRARTP
jgi:hypothetical protein